MTRKDKYGRQTSCSQPLSYADKMRIAGFEAKITLGVLLLIIIFWVAAGFGLSHFDIKLFETPLWVLAGTLGTWIFTCALSVFLVRRVFCNFSLDDD